MSGELSDLDTADDPASAAESYRAVSPWAIVALLLGLGSALVLIHPLLSIVPALATVASLLALWQIDHYRPTYIGRRAALAGLALAVLFSAAAASRRFVEYRLAAAEGRRYGERFLGLLVAGEPMQAHQLTMSATSRMPPDESMLELYRSDPTRIDGLRRFVQEPAVRTLLELGEQARVRFYETDTAYAHGDQAAVSEVFAVTFEQEGREKTFFVRLVLTRDRKPGQARAHWMVVQVLGDVRPSGFAGDE